MKAAIRIAVCDKLVTCFRCKVMTAACTITEVAAFEPVALRKTSMYGKPVGELNDPSMSPKLKSVAIKIPSPNAPLRATEANMLAGITVEAA